MTFFSAVNQAGAVVAVDADTVSAVVPVPGLELTHSYVRGTTQRNLIIVGAAASLVAAWGLTAFAVALTREDGTVFWVIASKVQAVQAATSTLSEVVLAPDGNDRIRASGTVAAVIALLSTASSPLDPFTVWPTFGTVRTLFFGPGCSDLLTPNSGPVFGVGPSGAGAALSNGQVDTPGRMGVGTFSTGSTAAGRVSYSTALTSLVNEGILRCRTDVKFVAPSDGVETFLVYAGFFDGASAEPNNGAYFKYDFAVAGGNWQFITAAGGVRSAVDTGIPAADTVNWKALEIELTPTQARWAIQGVIGATVTGPTIPTLITQVFGMGANLRKTLGVNVRQLLLDLQGFSQTGLAAR